MEGEGGVDWRSGRADLVLVQSRHGSLSVGYRTYVTKLRA